MTCASRTSSSSPVDQRDVELSAGAGGHHIEEVELGDRDVGGREQAGVVEGRAGAVEVAVFEGDARGDAVRTSGELARVDVRLLGERLADLAVGVDGAPAEEREPRRMHAEPNRQRRRHPGPEKAPAERDGVVGVVEQADAPAELREVRQDERGREPVADAEALLERALGQREGVAVLVALGRDDGEVVEGERARAVVSGALALLEDRGEDLLGLFDLAAADERDGAVHACAELARAIAGGGSDVRVLGEVALGLFPACVGEEELAESVARAEVGRDGRGLLAGLREREGEVRFLRCVRGVALGVRDLRELGGDGREHVRVGHLGATALEGDARGDEVAHRHGRATEQERDGDVLRSLAERRGALRPAVRFVGFAGVERALGGALAERQLRLGALVLDGAHPRGDHLAPDETVLGRLERAAVRVIAELGLATTEKERSGAGVSPRIVREAMLERLADADERLGRRGRDVHVLERVGVGREREEPALARDETGDLERAKRRSGSAEERQIVLVPAATAQRERDEEPAAFDRNLGGEIARRGVLRCGPPRLETDEVVVLERREGVSRERRDPAALVRVVERGADLVDLAAHVAHRVDARNEQHDERQAPLELSLRQLRGDRAIPRAGLRKRHENGCAPSLNDARDLRSALRRRAVDVAHAETRSDLAPHGVAVPRARRHDQRARRAHAPDEVSAKRFDRPIVDDMDEKNPALTARHPLIERREVACSGLSLRRHIPQQRCFNG